MLTHENFFLDEPSSWAIIKEDKYVRSRSRYFKPLERCSRCRQFDHSVKNCPRVPHCHLCGDTSHITRYQCPNNICFKVRYFKSIFLYVIKNFILTN